jgi:CheY-like chemotaxis protein
VGTLNPKQMDYIQTIKLNSKNLLNIINDILDLSKIEEGKLEMEHAEFDVFEIISQVEKSLHLAATNKNLDLITAIDTSVPRKIMGDSTRLNQVVTNLTNNAIKFTNEGSVCIEINTVQLDKLKSIFEPFTQEKSSTTRLYGGTGLGLTISNEIIHAFGGQIEVKSSPDVGSEFYFIIAFEIPSYTIQKNCIDFKEENENIELFGKYTILLVEDNPFNQMVAEDTLKDWNGELEILIAENGEEALEKLKNQAFDLVLMDIQMPVMDGHIATQKARNELNISIPILAMTAQATPSEIEQCLLSGMNDYVSKPFDEKVLFSKIVKWIRSDLLL